MLPELINTLSRDIKVTPVSHGDHNLAQQRLGVECMWWIARAKKSGLIRRHDTVRKVNPNWKKCLSILTTPVAWFTAWTCAFENRVDMDATQMNSGITWQQRSLSSSGSHVSWRVSKETRESLSAQWLWTVSTKYCSGLVICSHYKYYFCIFLPLCIFSTPYQPNSKTNKQQASGRGNRPLRQRKHLMVWLLT